MIASIRTTARPGAARRATALVLAALLALGALTGCATTQGPEEDGPPPHGGRDALARGGGKVPGRLKDEAPGHGGLDDSLAQGVLGGLFRRRRQPERIIERMDMKGPGVMHRLEIMRAAQHLAHLIGRPGFHVGAEVHAQHGDMVDQALRVVGAPHREASVARQHAGHIGLGDRAAHVFDAGVRQRPQLLGARQADPLDDRLDTLGKSRRHEAAIAARCVRRNPLRLQHRDRPAAPRNFARDREPGKSGADDAKIDVEVMAQRRPPRHRSKRETANLSRLAPA